MFKIRLKNYRGFVNEELTFSKINILIGENSAGKSSIFKFLLALKQSLRTPNNRDSNLTFSGIDTDLGNYKETVFNHEIDRNIYFSFEFLQGYFQFFLKEAVNYQIRRGEEDKIRKQIQQKRDDTTSLLGGEILEPNLIEFELTNDLSSHSNIKTLISNKSIGSVRIAHKRDTESQAEQDIYLINDKPTCSIIFKDGSRKYVFSEISYEKMGFLSIISDTDFEAKIREEVNLDETVSDDDKQKFAEVLYLKIAYLLTSQNYIQAQLSGIEYINPILSKPADRVYLEGDKRNTRRTGDIKELVDFLSTNNTRPQFKESLLKALSNFGIADDVYVKREGFTRELRVVLNGLDSNIKDVGYGVSLQLPILAQAIISDGTARLRNGEEIIKGETLLIEQPEVHLHPRLQAKFINALLQIGSNNRYIIETHSEHIVRMLQIIVKESRYNISADDISINYFKNEDGKMVKTMHLIDSKTGKLTPSFPKGFYDVSYNLAFELMD